MPKRRELTAGGQLIKTSDLQRRVALARLEGKADAEIADDLGVSPRAVYSAKDGDLSAWMRERFAEDERLAVANVLSRIADALGAEKVTLSGATVPDHDIRLKAVRLALEAQGYIGPGARGASGGSGQGEAAGILPADLPSRTADEIIKKMLEIKNRAMEQGA